MRKVRKCLSGSTPAWPTSAHGHPFLVDVQAGTMGVYDFHLTPLARAPARDAWEKESLSRAHCPTGQGHNRLCPNGVRIILVCGLLQHHCVGRSLHAGTRAHASLPRFHFRHRLCAERRMVTRVEAGPIANRPQLPTANLPHRPQPGPSYVPAWSACSSSAHSAGLGLRSCQFPGRRIPRLAISTMPCTAGCGTGRRNSISRWTCDRNAPA